MPEGQPSPERGGWPCCLRSFPQISHGPRPIPFPSNPFLQVLRMSSAIQVAKTATYLPDLVEVQRASFKWFLEKGLIEELESFSPITDYTGKLELHFIGSEYRLKRPRHDVEEAKRRDATFASQMYVTCRLVNKETGEIKEQEVFIGELPLMTERGTFIINGAERVIVNQIVRSPGVYFKDEQDKNGRKTFNASLI
ncbi:MAG: DNA-directed polymerase subunit beta, partial [Cyanobacteriota bacterium]